MGEFVTALVCLGALFLFIVLPRQEDPVDKIRLQQMEMMYF